MVLDTARAYGRSEEVLGKVLHGGWNERVTIVTKLSPLLECPVDATKETIKAFVDASVYQSCTALGVKNLDVLMLHRAAHIDEWEGMIWQRLLQLKTSNVIKELGVSVQNPDELEKALSTQEITFIQMPFNIMDWRWNSMIAKILSAKLERKLTIHVRSSLLQGLLSSNDINLWKKANVENGEEVIQWLVKQTTFCARLNTTDLCLSYVNAQNWIDGIVIGMESLEQVIENIKYLNSPSLNDMEIQQIKKSRPKLNDITLNPAFWRN
jgi:spore coat polysaccharide biosynthesis protein SpsF